LLRITTDDKQFGVTLNNSAVKRAVV